MVRTTDFFRQKESKQHKISYCRGLKESQWGLQMSRNICLQLDTKPILKPNPARPPNALQDVAHVVLSMQMSTHFYTFKGKYLYVDL